MKIVFVALMLLGSVYSLAWEREKLVFEDETCVDPMIPKPTPVADTRFEAFAAEVKRLDVNQDNQICADEVQEVSPATAGYWSKYDRDKDGCISRAELKNRFRGEIQAQFIGQFHSMDRNRDGSIDIKDATKAEQRKHTIHDIISLYDKNSDSKIDQNEFVTGSLNRLRIHLRNLKKIRNTQG